MNENSMNENAEEPSKEMPNSSKLLSGSSLLQIHVNTGKSLPKDGAKDFCPSNSWMEKKQIQCALDERKDLLDIERVDKWSCLAGAIWNHKKKLAEVTRRAGKHFQTLGFEKEGILYLYPEEALYMLETNSLELDFGGVSVSIQQGYSLLLGPSTGCELNEYRTYSHLMRQGYRLLRFTNQIVHTKYERSIRLDQHVPVKRNHPGQIGENEKNRYGTSLSQNLKAENDVVSKTPFNREEIPCPSEKIITNATNTIVGGSDSSGGLIEETTTCTKKQGEELELPQSQIVMEDLVSILKNSEQKEREFSSDSNGIERTIHDACDVSESPEQTVDTGEKPKVEEESGEQDNEKIDSEGSCEQMQQPDESFLGNISTDGLRTKAYGIAESLLSMGSALVGKRPTEDHNSIVDTNTPEILTATLQSEIIKMLGTQLDTGVSEEALAAVASTAASTILTHVSNSGNEDLRPEVHRHENICESEKHLSGLDMDQSPKENIVSEAADSDSVMVCSSNDEGNKKNACLQNQNTDSNDSGSVLVYASNDTVEIGKEKGSQHLKRPATSEETMVHNQPSKKSKMVENDEEDIEILDYVPEKRQVELVDLSDDSSDSDSVHGIKVDECDNNSIEVIDVGDSSSSSSEFTSNETSNDSSVIVEEKNIPNREYSWDVERRQILEIIPNMHNLIEITLKPPRSDLLPENVKPQCSLYHINRQRLVESGRERSTNPPHNLSAQEVGFGNSNLSCIEPLPPSLIGQRPDFNYGAQHYGNIPQSMWQPQPGVPINPVEAVQAIARLVLPMLGLPASAPMLGLLPNVFPPEQNSMWVPNNAWFPHRPWGPRRAGPWRPGNRGMGLRHNASRGNNFQRFRSRPYGNRRSARRYPQRGRGANHNWQYSNNIQLQTVSDECPMNEQSSSQALLNDSPKTQGPSSWKQMKTKKTKTKQGKGSRYFNPPKRYLHMHEILDKNRSEDVMSSSASEKTNSPNIKSESDSSDEDSSSENMDENENNSSLENTDESCSSPTGVKPLLSPRECTDFESVFKSVQVIKEADTQSLLATSYEHRLKPKFDLFSPTKPFKKGNPPLPDFHLCIMRASDLVPAPGEISVLMEALNDSVPVMFAVVSPDSISFFKFYDVSLPSVTDNL